MSKAHAEKVDRLRQSVAEIMKSDAPDKDELLQKSFEEFEEALDEDFEQDDDVLEGEYEEIDPVVAFADAVATADAAVAELMEAGELDEDTAALMAQWSAISDVGLRSLANTRAVPVEEYELDEVGKADGVYEMSLAKADGDYDNEPESILVKTDLPERVAQFITDPAELASAIEEIGVTIADYTGLPLAKFDPETGEEMEGGAPPVEALVRQLQIMMRLNAASLVQGEAILRGISGGGEPMEGEEEMMDESGEEEGVEEEEASEDEEFDQETPEEEASEEEEAPEEEEEEQAFRRAHEAEDLKKAVDSSVREATAGLSNELKKAQAEIERLRSMPQAPKAPLISLTKAADNGGGADEDPMAKIAALPESQRSIELMKLVHKAPIPVNS